MRRILYLVLWLPVTCLAGTQTGKITEIIARSDNLHYFYLEGSATDRPACAQQRQYWMIKDENSTYGKTQITMLLAAHSSGESVTVVGTGECTRWYDGEDVNYIIYK